MQNVNAIDRFALFFAPRVKTRSIWTELRSVSSVASGDPDGVCTQGSVRCRWRAGADGKLRMEWLIASRI